MILDRSMYFSYEMPWYNPLYPKNKESDRTGNAGCKNNQEVLPVGLLLIERQEGFVIKSLEPLSWFMSLFPESDAPQACSHMLSFWAEVPRS